MNCPSDLQLEAHLLDRARSPVVAHVAGCEQCGARLARMEQEGEDFRRYVYPATVDALTSPPRRRLWVLLSTPALAMAAAAIALVIVRQPPDGYVGAKGAALKLTVYAGANGGARPVADREQVQASAPLRFKVQPSAPCRLVIVSVDEGGQVSRLFPAVGDSAFVDQLQTLPGGALLDGRAGPERIYAVCSDVAVPFSQLEQAVRDAAGRGEASVRKAGPLRRLPRGSMQATLLLEKK